MSPGLLHALTRAPDADPRRRQAARRYLNTTPAPSAKKGRDIE